MCNAKNKVIIKKNNFLNQIIIKSALGWLESKTKIFGVAIHLRHSQNLDSLLHLNTKYDKLKKSVFWAIFVKCDRKLTIM